eukprot:GFUD01038804.1.p1 GENE.GFUD01038804.1~~GFUD01038804.1.p1  ORF type:complete len:307 (-),score=86.20 GFUD01038804.1:85-1005(-)
MNSQCTTAPFQSRSVPNSPSHTVPSSRPALARRDMNAVPQSSLENLVEEKCWTDNESAGSSEESFKSCVEDFSEKGTFPIPRCVHKYEVGVIVVRISSEYLHLVIPLGDNWVETCVDPFKTLVIVDGLKTREVYSVKIGAMGYMVVQECVKCQMDMSDVATVNPSLLWFGEDQGPSAREVTGVVVGKEGDKMVVQLEGPAAARIARLVLFFGDLMGQKEYGLQTKVLVWAWARQLRGGGGGKYLEGAAVVNLKDIEHGVGDHELHVEVDVAAAVSDGGQVACGVMSGSNNRQLLRLLLHRLLCLWV